MDDQLRELERRFERTGAVEDGVAWLTARLRADHVTRHDLEVAALCGHAAARAVVLSGERHRDDLVLTRELADLTGCEPGVVLSWMKRGCPVVRLPKGDVLHDPLAVLGWLEEHGWAEGGVDPSSTTSLMLDRRHHRAAMRFVLAQSVESEGEDPALLRAVQAWLDDPVPARRKVVEELREDASGAGATLACDLARNEGLGLTYSRSPDVARARAALSAWALGPRWPGPRHEVQARDGVELKRPPGPKVTRRHVVLDRRTGRIVGSWSGKQLLVWPGRSFTDVAGARLAPGGEGLILLRRDGTEEEVGLR